MNLLWHHLRKDVRHVRWGLGIWGVLLAVQFGVVLAGAWELDEMTRAFVQVLGFLVPVLQTLLLLVLVPWLMQDEPAVGTTAFWLTRPLTPEFVLGSKAVFVLAMILGPQIGVELLLMGVNGMDGRWMVLSVPEVVLKTLSTVLPLAVVAAVTPSIGRYALWLIGTFVAMAVLSTVVMFLTLYFGDDRAWAVETSGTMGSSSQIVSGLLYIVGGTVLVWWQYRTRQTGRTILVGAVLLVLAFNSSMLWPIDFMARKVPGAEEVGVPVGDVRVVGEKRSLHATGIAPLRSHDEPHQELRMELSLAGLPKGMVGVVREVKGEGFFEDGTVVRDEIRQRDAHPSTRQVVREVVPVVLPGARELGDGGKGQELTEVLRLKKREAERLRETPFQLDLEMEWELFAGRVVYRLPLREGSDYHDGSRRETVQSFSRLGGEVTVTLLVRNVQLLLAPGAGGARGLGIDGEGVVYGLYHPERNEFWPGDLRWDWQAGLFQGQMFVIRPRQIVFRAGGKGEALVDESWLGEAELVRITMDPVARLVRTFRVGGLVLKEAK